MFVALSQRARYQSGTDRTVQIVEWAFGKRMTPQERLRKHQRALEKTQRELDRERVKLENQEKKLVQDIKKSAKNGQMGPLRIQAKDLVRTRRYALHETALQACTQLTSRRRYIQKFYQMRTQLQAISLRIQVRAVVLCSLLQSLIVYADRPQQRADDAVDEGRNGAVGQHE